MNIPEHTPAPWTYIAPRPYDGDDVDLEGSFYTAGSIEGADGNPVCIFGDSYGSGTMYENPVNPHLIAAAPDLLEICKTLVLQADKQGLHLGPLVADAEAAIAKATGQ